jgi:hypothetical protein
MASHGHLASMVWSRRRLRTVKAVSPFPSVKSKSVFCVRRGGGLLSAVRGCRRLQQTGRYARRFGGVTVCHVRRSRRSRSPHRIGAMNNSSLCAKRRHPPAQVSDASAGHSLHRAATSVLSSGAGTTPTKPNVADGVSDDFGTAGEVRLYRVAVLRPRVRDRNTQAECTHRRRERVLVQKNARTRKEAGQGVRL